MPKRLVLEHRDEYGTEYAASSWPAACTGRAAGSVKITAAGTGTNRQRAMPPGLCCPPIGERVCRRQRSPVPDQLLLHVVLHIGHHVREHAHTQRVPCSPPISSHSWLKRGGQPRG